MHFAKLLSKFPRNGIVLSPELAFSSKSIANPFRQSSPSHFSKICSITAVSGSFRVGFLSNNFSKGTPRNFHSGRRSSSFGWLTVDGVVLGFVLANVAVFMLWNAAGPEFMKKHFTISIDNLSCGRLHTLITSAFSHTNGMHLFENMIGVFFFGTSIGRVFGPEYLLKLYLSGAFVGSIFYLAYHAILAPLFQTKPRQSTEPKVAAMGAGAPMIAIVLLDVLLFPRKTRYLEFIIPVPAYVAGIFVIGGEMLRARKKDGEASGASGLGGIAVAFSSWVKCRRGRF